MDTFIGNQSNIKHLKKSDLSIKIVLPALTIATEIK